MSHILLSLVFAINGIYTIGTEVARAFVNIAKVVYYVKHIFKKFWNGKGTSYPPYKDKMYDR
jgi:hypothetical protein